MNDNIGHFLQDLRRLDIGIDVHSVYTYLF